MFGDEQVKFLESVGGFGCENDFMALSEESRKD